MNSAKQKDTTIPTTGDSTQLDKRRYLILYATLLLVVFLVGLIAMWLTSRTFARERDAAQASLQTSG